MRQQQLFVVGTGQQIRVQQLDLPLAVPELGQVGLIFILLGVYSRPDMIGGMS